MAGAKAKPKAQVETSKVPQVDGFKIKGKLSGSLKQLGSVLRTITFLEVAQEKDVVEAAYIEKRDINKAPYLFSIIRIGPKELEVVFSIPSGIAPHKRRLDVVMYLLNILSVIESQYKVDQKVIYQLLENTINKLSESITPEYAKLYTAYDTLKKENEGLHKRVARLGEENQALTTRNFEIKGKNDELRVRLGELENLSDEALKSRIQEWVLEHNGEMNIFEFCKVHHVNETRVEEMLNQLVNEGYFAVVQ